MEHAEHFQTVAIRRFRGLGALDLNEIGTFNVLVGANDVGKTSVLEAIFLLSNVAHLGLPIRIQNWRQYMVGEFGGLSPLFHEIDVEAPVTLEAHSGKDRRTLAISAPHQQTAIDMEAQRAVSSSNDKENGTGRDGESGVRSSSSIHFGVRALHYDATVRRASEDDPIRFSGTLVDRGEEWSVIGEPGSSTDTTIPAIFLPARPGYDEDAVGEVIVSKKTDALLDYLRVINPRVEQITTRGKAAYVDVGLDRYIPLNMFGSGMVRAAAILAPAITQDVRMILIDEIEYGLHYSAIPALLRSLLTLSGERRVQVFVTTQSLDVLRGLQAVLSEPTFSRFQPTTACYALERDEHGLVRPFRYDYDQFGHCVVGGLEIR